LSILPCQGIPFNAPIRVSRTNGDGLARREIIILAQKLIAKLLKGSIL
jgi:hypothetical protein